MHRFIVLILTISILIVGGCSIERLPSYVSDTTNTEESVSGTDYSSTSNPSETITDTTHEETVTEAETTSSQDETSTPNVSTTDISAPSNPHSFVSDAIKSVSAANAFIYNSTDSVLLAGKGDGVNIVPASITKLLTALYALEVAPPDLVITATSDVLSLVGRYSSIANIKTNHRLTVSQLIQGMMMPSGNDAAYVLAAGIGRYLSNDPSLPGRDAVDLFMKGLNQYAVKIGCIETNFTVPDGLAKSDHYTSIHDMIIFGKLASENPLISKYANTVSENVTIESGQTLEWNNSNLLINPGSEFYSPYVNGLKTGSLSGNYCLYVSAVINGKIYLIGIFGAPQKNGRYEDAHKLIDAIIASENEAGG